MTLQKAVFENTDRIMEIIESARAYLKSQGHDQWQNGYPFRSDIEADIEKGNGYVFSDEDGIFGYAAVIFGDEPCYHDIRGAWLTDRPYAVIHRMAIGGGKRGRGLGVKSFGEIEKYVASRGFSAIRVDTHEKNKVMLRVIEKSGFTRCGLVMLRDGERIGFEKDL